MKAPLRGEVWMVDLGLAAKVRPCLVLSVATEESDRSLVTLIAHTTSLRESRFEIVVSVRFLWPGAFDAQGIVTVPTVRLINRLGALSAEQVQAVAKGVCAWLGIDVGAQPSQPLGRAQQPRAGDAQALCRRGETSRSQVPCR